MADARPDLDRRTALAGLLLVIALAAGLRLAGHDWGGANLLHPDERFISMVTTALEPDQPLLDYFDTGSSTLNPENVGSQAGFVYGTYPVIMVRLLAEVLGWTDLGGIRSTGRLLSTIWDLLTVILVFVLASRLTDRRTGLLAAFFLAVAVLHIQHSHYFTVDLVQVFFVTLSLYLAVRIAEPGAEPDTSNRPTARQQLTVARLGLGLLFGAAAAAAVAAKLSAAPVVVLLPAAHAVRLAALDGDRRRSQLLPTLVVLIASGLVFGLSFRLLQPYAFIGPGVFDIGLNPRWLSAIDSLRGLTGPDADWPPAMQWARRSVFFAGRNLVLWGLGLPLGALAFAGLGAALIRVVRRGVGPLALVVGWTLGYFVWQSLGDNPMMRYQLPIYPTLAFFAAWLLATMAASEAPRRRWAALALGVVVASASLLWAVAFTGIYLRPVTREAASRWLFAEVPGPINVIVESPAGPARQPAPAPSGARLAADRPLETRFRALVEGTLRRLELPRVVLVDGGAGTSEAGPPSLSAELTVEGGGTSGATGTCAPSDSGFSCSLALDVAMPIRNDDRITVRIELAEGDDRRFTVVGGAIANETSWDDGLPLRIDGYDPFAGIYQPDLTFELYWNDDERKRERMLDILDRADIIAISSNRQWASLTRIPERFPLVETYYRELIGCPSDRSVIDCFIDAEAGSAIGSLGFEIAAVFTSSPRLGPFAVNDQWAEEAFTVYDHPKVLLFRKTGDDDPARVRAILESVDLDRVIVKPPGHFGRQPADLMLPTDRFVRQQRGGTWRERFPPDSPLNRWPVLGAAAWYLALAVIGLGAAPLVRWALGGLADGALPLARGFGLLLVAWTVWMVGSTGITIGPGTVRLAVALLVAAGAAVAWRTRGELWDRRAELGRQLLSAELVFAFFFAVSLAVRALNPDLWHPGHGGEKPMDLSYFTAVLRSVGFPPYDPWFAGGYINYYYFGFVIVGQLALALGIEPAIAYNLAIPTAIGLAAAGAYSVAVNLVRSGGEPPGAGAVRRLRPALAGVAAASAVTLAGNLHPVRMLIQGLVALGADSGRSAVAAFATGLARLATGAGLPIPSHHWFWNPTRIIPDPEVVPITEFPAFTFIYGDLHAHLLDLPQVVAAMAFALAMLTGAGSRGRRLAAIALGALAVGAMRPTNTWSYYPFLAMGMIAVGWSIRASENGVSRRLEPVRVLGWVAGFAVLTRLLYLPFDAWFGMGYSQVVYWNGARTPLTVYLEHWGVFLFPVATWLLLELHDWMAATPLAAIRPLSERLWPMLALGVPALAGQILLVVLGVGAAWVAWPMLVAAGLLLLRRELPPARSFGLLAVGLGLGLTMVVELVTLRFDLGRMNTVFKFYYVAWVLLAVVAAAGLWWRAARRPDTGVWRVRLWWLAAGALIAGAALYPITAIPAKASDRMAPRAPRGLDGLAYMEHAVHHDQGRPLVFAEDLAAIRWLQRHVDGTPTIVEANIPEYRWGSRITVATGLPGVVGWNWHQRQQRGWADDRWVWDRVRAVNEFYTTTDPAAARSFLDRYDVDWIVVGQLERAYYPDDGLTKFRAFDGELWSEAFRTRETSIYEVIRDED